MYRFRITQETYVNTIIFSDMNISAGLNMKNCGVIFVEQWRESWRIIKGILDFQFKHGISKHFQNMQVWIWNVLKF